MRALSPCVRERMIPDRVFYPLAILVVATDLYVWKLVRRDMRRSTAELRTLMENMIQAALTA